MCECQRPKVSYPCRVPLKVFGRKETFQPERVAELILGHLGPQPEDDRLATSHAKGDYIAYTFWITLPNEQVELPLRKAVGELPGYVMQL